MPCSTVTTWVIDGQKIWTSFATHANWIFVLARTDPTVPKHRGISFLLCPMDTPGVEVRPIRMLTGGSEFNEVFFDGARVPAGNVVGPVHGGWAVAMSLLGHERGEEAALNPIMFRHEFDRLVALARDYGLHRRASHPRRDSRGASSASRSCGCSGCASSRSTCATATSGRRRPSPSSTGASTTRSPRIWRWRSWVHRVGARGPRATARLPHRRPRRAELHRVVGARVDAERRERHRLRGHVAGATQHPRREHPRTYLGNHQRHES